MTQILAYRFRLLPSRKQHAALRSILEEQRHLYNAALQERIEAYRKSGMTLSYVAQCASLTVCRNDLPEMSALPLCIQRGTLKRLDEAFKGFFARNQKKQKAGFPRFRGKGWFTSFECREFRGISFADARLTFKGMPGRLRVHLHRPAPDGKILTAKFKLDSKGWIVCLVVRVATPEKREITRAVGVDVGLKTLAATSDGLLIPNPRAARRAHRKMRARQRQLARCKPGSRRSKKIRVGVAKLHQKIANTRATALHQVSALLARRYDLIAVEALATNRLAKSMLARDVHDAGWSKLRGFLRYKAERAGAHFVEVDPRFTSQDCPECGRREPKTLQQRTHSCVCGCVLDRDVAAARIILSRAVAGPEARNVASYGERALENLVFSDESQPICGTIAVSR